MKIFALLLSLTILAFSNKSLACSPCQALSGITQTINGTNLELTFVSNAGWQCCYNVNIEIICADANFTGVANYLSPQICINGGTAASSTWPDPEPYPLTVIDISGFCPGTYKWRGIEPACGIYTPEYTFVVAGASPMIVTSSVADPVICIGEQTQLSSTAQNGCNGPYTFSWSPATGLSNPNSANPVATPGSTTTYTVTVTEPGSCAVTQTSQVTVEVDPLPTATIAQNVGVCLNDPSPTVTITGATGTPPYSINYTIDGVAQPTITTTGSTFQFPAPTNTVGTSWYTLVDVTDSSPSVCSQNQTGAIAITVWDLPNVNAGPDVEICEPNPTSPSDVTLTGSGAATYVWDNNVVNGVSFVPATGVTVYTVTGTDANGCENTDQVTVTAYPMPIADGNAAPLFGNVPLTVNYGNSSQLANNYVWSFGDGNTQTTTNLVPVSNTFTIPGTYTTVLTASNGICFDTWTIVIDALPPMEVTPPNIFTPNGDGSNELYFIDVRFGENFEGMIFNRWGQHIATVNGINAGWDGKSNGKDVEEGVYFIKYWASDFNDQKIEGHTYFHLTR